MICGVHQSCTKACSPPPPPDSPLISPNDRSPSRIFHFALFMSMSLYIIA